MFSSKAVKMTTDASAEAKIIVSGTMKIVIKPLFAFLAPPNCGGHSWHATE